MFVYPLSIRCLISFYQEESTRSEYRSCITKEIILNDTIVKMFLFRPGIREEEIQFINFSGSEYLWYLLTKYFQENHIISPLARTFFIGTNEPFVFELYAHTCCIRMIFGIITQEVSHTRSYLEHQLLFSEEFLPVPFLSKHLCLIAPNTWMFGNFLDIDILVGHVQIVAKKEILQVKNRQIPTKNKKIILYYKTSKKICPV